MQNLEQAKQFLDADISTILLPSLDSHFIYAGVTLGEDELLGPHLQAEIENKAISRKLTVVYIPAGNGRKEVLSVHVENMLGDTFTVREFLKHSGMKEEPGLDISSHVGDLSKRLASALQANASTLRESLSEVIAGKEWTHVPIDWCGYK